MKLKGACDINIKGIQYTHYHITTLLWDLTSRDINIVVVFNDDSVNSTNRNYTFRTQKEEILVNDLINKVKNKILDDTNKEEPTK